MFLNPHFLAIQSFWEQDIETCYLNNRTGLSAWSFYRETILPSMSMYKAHRICIVMQIKDVLSVWSVMLCSSQDKWSFFNIILPLILIGQIKPYPEIDAIFFFFLIYSTIKRKRKEKRNTRKENSWIHAQEIKKKNETLLQALH